MSTTPDRANAGSGLEPSGIIDGRYAIIRELGRGGMGAVYEAEQIKLQKRVALKVMQADLARRDDGGTSVKRFLREARVCSSIHHRNVVAILDFGDLGDGSTYYVMELLRGEDLSSRLKSEGALQWTRVRWLLRQVLSGLEAAHDKGIVHRDIKPANILLLDQTDEFGAEWIKVVDFGIAKVQELDGASQLTGTSELIGTVAYMAPEGARGGQTDERADLYSVGVVAYQLLTGTLPFRGGNALNVLVQHVNDPPRPPRQIVPELPPAAESFVLRAMAKDPGDRYQSAQEMIEALDAFGSPPLAGAAALDPSISRTSSDRVARRRRVSGPLPANESAPKPDGGHHELSQALPDAETVAIDASPSDPAPPESRRRRPIGLLVVFGGVTAGISVLAAWLVTSLTVQPASETEAYEPKSAVVPNEHWELVSAARGPSGPESVVEPTTKLAASTGVANGEPADPSDTLSDEPDDVAAAEVLDAKVTETPVSIKRCESYECRQQRAERQLRRAVRQECRSSTGDEVTVKITIGTEGKALMTRALPPHDGSALGKCVVAVADRASFPAPKKLVIKQWRLKP